MDEELTTPIEGEIPEHDPTPEEIEEWERERAEREAAKIAPFRAAAAERHRATDINAEHDDLLAELLFEITVNEIEDI